MWDVKRKRKENRKKKQNAGIKKAGWNIIKKCEWQFKPKKRQQTLESLLFTLNHILLLNYGAKEYNYNKIDESALAADNKLEYNKK